MLVESCGIFATSPQIVIPHFASGLNNPSRISPGRRPFHSHFPPACDRVSGPWQNPLCRKDQLTWAFHISQDNQGSSSVREWLSSRIPGHTTDFRSLSVGRLDRHQRLGQWVAQFTTNSVLSTFLLQPFSGIQSFLSFSPSI